MTKHAFSVVPAAAVLLLTSSVSPLTSLAQETSLEQLENQVDTQQREIEELKEQIETMGEAMDTAVKASAKTSAIHIGGYGELHYNNLDNEGPAGGEKKQIDFHCFVLIFGHDFDERTRFFSEVELEHALVEGHR